MNNKELADKVVALGVGIRSMTCVAEGDPSFYLLNKQTPIGFADKFVRDWRVAGALMERYAESSCDTELRSLVWTYGKDSANGPRTYTAESETLKAGIKEATNDSLPRAIIEACVEALTDE